MDEFLEFPQLDDEFEDYIFISHNEILNHPNDTELGSLVRKRYVEAQNNLKKSPIL